jgi:hypothetical protein
MSREVPSFVSADESNEVQETARLLGQGDHGDTPEVTEDGLGSTNTHKRELHGFWVYSFAAEARFF